MEDIIFNEIPGKYTRFGDIKLNRPKSLNALTQDMIKALFERCSEWATNPKIGGVIIRSLNDKAFCAGGDIRHLYQEGLAKNPEVMTFFQDEYRLNHLLFHYPKPYLAFMNGITMGGGVGISVYASHRFVTEKYAFAMPEAKIGFFPDIGGSYFLSHLTHNMGSYLALTCDKINAHAAITLGLADHLIKIESLEEILTKLFNCDLRENPERAIKHVIQPFLQPIKGGDTEVLTQQVDPLFKGANVQDILGRLENAGEWGVTIAKKIAANSPTSLKVICSQLEKGKTKSLGDCLKMEYTMTQHFLKGHDFYEGVRAMVIDKDQTPKWDPNTLDKVTDAMVEDYFVEEKVLEL